jgi:hypothetical protein
MLTKWIVAAAMLAAANSANAATYLGTRSVGTFTAQLSITTDDTLGTLTADNIVDWTVILSSAADNMTLTADDARLQIFGSALSATATDLLFDFSASTQAYLLIQSTLGDRSMYCVQSVNCFDQNRGEEIISFGPLFNNFQRVPVSGVQAIASTAPVPEPASWALMIAGFGLAGVVMRRKVQVAFA